MSTVNTYNIDSGDTTSLSIKTNGTTALTLDSSQRVGLGVTPAGTGLLELKAGTTSLVPLEFNSGSNRSTAVAGGVEYDGKVFYATPVGTQRGVIPGAQYFRLNSDLAGANAATTQNIFGVGVTLSAGTVYEFEGVYLLTKSAGTTSHNQSIGFGGTATLNNIFVSGFCARATTSIPYVDTGPIGFAAVSTADITLFTGVTGAALWRAIHVRGSVSVNAGGTFIPTYTLSAAPGGAYSTAAGSYFLIYPIGASGANTSVGTWA